VIAKKTGRKAGFLLSALPVLDARQKKARLRGLFFLMA